MGWSIIAAGPQACPCPSTREAGGPRTACCPLEATQGVKWGLSHSPDRHPRHGVCPATSESCPSDLLAPPAAPSCPEKGCQCQATAQGSKRRRSCKVPDRPTCSWTAQQMGSWGPDPGLEGAPNSSWPISSPASQMRQKQTQLPWISLCLSCRMFPWFQSPLL